MNPVQMFRSHIQQSLCHCLPSAITKHPLIGKIISDWKVILMDCSTIVAVSCFAIAFFNGAAFFSAAFFILSVALCVAAYQTRQFSTLTDLRDTASDLRKTKDKIESAAKDLKKENDRLAKSNRELEQNNARFQESNQRLILTNNRLQQEVAQLTLQVTQLRESAEKIRSEVVRFHQENSQLNTHVKGFDESLRVLDLQLVSSRALCEQIGNHLANQSQGLGEQLTQLGTYLHELRTDHRVHEKIQELNALQQQMHKATQDLHQVQLQYTAERAHFQAIHEALLKLKEEFDRTIRETANHLQSNNVEFKKNVAALSLERQKIQDLINRHCIPCN
jgi:uncharacterized phage infection (PIP) family protein YhgE